MHGKPAVRPVVDIAQGHGLIEHGILQFFGLFDGVAEIFQTGPDQSFLKVAGIPVAARGLDSDTLTGVEIHGRRRARQQA